MESLRLGHDVFIPFLERNTELTPEDEKRLGEIIKVGLVIPADMVILILPFKVLLFVQNAEQLISQSET